MQFDLCPRHERQVVITERLGDGGQLLLEIGIPLAFKLHLQGTDCPAILQLTTHVGELFFHAEDQPRIHCYLFTASDYDGTPTETEEAVPQFYPLDEIPYDEMWEDNRYWLPLIISGHRVIGYSTFANQRLVDHKLSTL